MLLQKMKNRASLEYGLAVLSVALATAGRAVLDPYMGDSVPYVIYFLSNALVVRYTRLGPSICAILLATAAADYFFLPPRYSVVMSIPQAVTSTVFLAANLVFLAVAHGMRRAMQQAEKTALALDQERNILQAAMNGAGNSHLAYLDRDFNFVRVNETYARSCRLRPEEMVGRNHFALYPDRENELIFARARDTGQPVQFHDRPFVYPDQPERGVTYWDWTLTPVRDGAGQVVGLVLSLFETTGQKRAREALRQSEERLQATFDHAGVGLVEVDTNDRLIAVNEQVCRALGYARDELLGMTVHQLTHPDDRATSDRLNAELHAGKRQRLDYEKRYLKRDGCPAWVHVTVSPVRDNQGTWLRSIATVEEISERKKTEQALQQAQAELRHHAENLEKAVRERTLRLQELVNDLEHFSYTLSHDLRSPLRAIRSFSELMLESACGSCSCASRDFLPRIIRGAERMDNLISDALAYSRAVRGELRLTPINVQCLLSTIISTHAHLQAASADIALEGGFPQVMGNEAALTQCFENLLSNAVKFVAPGTEPRIRIRAEQPSPHRVRVWVEDNGIGVDRQHLPKLFQMFSRAASQYEGTGIGLALVKKNVERMGGSVGVESELGQGSRFWIELQGANAERVRRSQGPARDVDPERLHPGEVKP